MLTFLDPSIQALLRGALYPLGLLVKGQGLYEASVKGEAKVLTMNMFFESAVI